MVIAFIITEINCLVVNLFHNLVIGAAPFLLIFVVFSSMAALFALFLA